ncbi:MAG: DNA-processing protein DprA [Cytophagales bacterium]|nr:DNA-processing protein DprA [Cytophagales bacterium]
MTPTHYLLALSLIPGLGGTKIKHLVNHVESLEAVFKLTDAQLRKIPTIGPKLSGLIKDARKYLERASESLERAGSCGVRVLNFLEDSYPSRLKTIFDCPPVIFVAGNFDLEAERSVAIVGTRKATAYGRKVTEDIVKALQEFNPLVVSGLAYGIDIAAHKAALRCGLQTLGVMGTGIDSVYPKEHRSIAQKMLKQGGVVTENDFGVTADPRRFPARNRLIAGLSDVVVVVEAAERGGALITGHLANDYDREVYAVPGGLNMEFSRGCNKLVSKNQARLFCSVDQLVEEMGWGEISRKKPGAQLFMDNVEMSEDERRIVQVLREHRDHLHVDQLGWHVQLKTSKLLALLLQMELKGMLKMKMGNYVSL